MLNMNCIMIPYFDNEDNFFIMSIKFASDNQTMFIKQCLKPYSISFSL